MAACLSCHMLTDGNLSGEIIKEARKASFPSPAVCSPAEKQAQSTKHTCNNYSGSACCSASANYESLCGNKQIAPHSCDGRATSHSKSLIISCIHFAFQENFSATNLFVFYYYYYFFFFKIPISKPNYNSNKANFLGHFFTAPR